MGHTAGDKQYVTDGADPAVKLTVNSDGSINVRSLGSLVPETKDYVGLTYTGDNITTIVYKTGGSTGTTVATLTLAYSGDNLVSITRT